MTGTRGSTTAKRLGDHTGNTYANTVAAMTPADREEVAKRISTITMGGYAVQDSRVHHYTPTGDETGVEVTVRWDDYNEPMVMTFGRQVIFAGEFNEAGECTKEPVTGPMQHYKFEPGKTYRISWPMFEHMAERNLIETVNGKNVQVRMPWWERESAERGFGAVPVMGEYTEDNSIDLSKEPGNAIRKQAN